MPLVLKVFTFSWSQCTQTTCAKTSKDIHTCMKNAWKWFMIETGKWKVTSCRVSYRHMCRILSRNRFSSQSSSLFNNIFINNLSYFVFCVPIYRYIIIISQYALKAITKHNNNNLKLPKGCLLLDCSSFH